MDNGNIPNYLEDHHDANPNPVKLVGCTISILFPALLLSQLEESAAGLQYLHKMGLAHGDIQPVSFTSRSPFHLFIPPSNTYSLTMTATLVSATSDTRLLIGKRETRSLARYQCGLMMLGMPVIAPQNTSQMNPDQNIQAIYTLWE
jgi:serine/threonine protein kinase